jgi:hypothetical protein
MSVPPQPFIVREKSRQIVGMQIVSDLAQLRESCAVLPRKSAVSCSGSVCSKDIITEFFPVLDFTVTL